MTVITLYYTAVQNRGAIQIVLNMTIVGNMTVILVYIIHQAYNVSLIINNKQVFTYEYAINLAKYIYQIENSSLNSAFVDETQQRASAILTSECFNEEDSENAALAEMS